MMRVSVSVLALTGAAALLVGCSKPQSGSDQAAAPSEPASAPAEATPEQAKAIIATLPAPYNTADLDNGKLKLAICRSCHTTAQGGPNMTGPNLYGVFGRKAGSLDGFSYSDGLKATGIVWDAAHIDTWIADPRAVAPTTKMTYFGLKDAKDRIDAVAYLKVQTGPLPK
jgi:cytochrome c